MAEPPPGVELRADDGALYTGFVIVERSHPVLMLAVRHEPGRRSPQPPIVTPPPPSPIRPRLFDEEPAWMRDGDPFGRR